MTIPLYEYATAPDNVKDRAKARVFRYLPKAPDNILDRLTDPDDANIPWLANNLLRSNIGKAYPLRDPVVAAVAEQLANLTCGDLQTLADLQDLFKVVNGIIKNAGLKPKRHLEQARLDAELRFSANLDRVDEKTLLSWAKRMHKAHLNDPPMRDLPLVASSRLRRTRTGFRIDNGLLGTAESLTTAIVRIHLFEAAKAKGLAAVFLHTLACLPKYAGTVTAPSPSHRYSRDGIYARLHSRIQKNLEAGQTEHEIALSLVEALKQAKVIQDLPHLTYAWPDPDETCDWTEEETQRWKYLPKFRFFDKLRPQGRRRVAPQCDPAEVMPNLPELDPLAKTQTTGNPVYDHYDVQRPTQQETPSQPSQPPQQHLEVQVTLPQHLTLKTPENAPKQPSHYEEMELAQRDKSVRELQELAEKHFPSKPGQLKLHTIPQDPDKGFLVNTDLHPTPSDMGLDGSKEAWTYKGQKPTLELLSSLGPYGPASTNYQLEMDVDFDALAAEHTWPGCDIVTTNQDHLGMAARNYTYTINGGDTVVIVFGTLDRRRNIFVPDLATARFYPNPGLPQD